MVTNLSDNSTIFIKANTMMAHNNANIRANKMAKQTCDFESLLL